MKLLKTLAILTASLALAGQARANLITPNGILVTGDNDSAAFFNGLDGAGGIEDIVLLYKANYDDGVFDDEQGLFEDGGPSGPQFTIVHPDGDNQTATISWNLTGTGYDLYYVAWKGGNDFLYSGVEDDQRLIGGPHQIDTGLITVGKGNNPAISHIAFYGRPGVVPDGGATVALLGGALGVLAFLGGFRAKRK